MFKGILKGAGALLLAGVIAAGAAVFGTIGGFKAFKTRPGQEDMNYGQRLLDNAIDTADDTARDVGEVVRRNVNDRMPEDGIIGDLNKHFKKKGLNLTIAEQKKTLCEVCDPNDENAWDDKKCQTVFIGGDDCDVPYKDAPEYKGDDFSLD